jgi:hypothetical protein
MDLYEETHIKLLVRLTREAHEPNTSTRRFIALATAISDILYTIKKYHGFECLRRIIYMATAELGYSIGPLDVKTAKMLIDKGLIISNKITPTYKSPILLQ